MSSLFAAPPGYTLERLLSSAPDAELWSAKHAGAAVALRLVRYQGPTDPPPFLERMGEIARGLELTHLTQGTGSGTLPGGFWYAEAWLEGPTFADAPSAAGLAPLVRELLRLHQAKKWHGGLSAARLKRGPDGFVALQFPWAAWLSTLPRARAERLEPAAAGAPERSSGPKMSSPGLDTHALGRLLAPHLATPAGQAWVRRALLPVPADRPLLSELLPLL